MEIAFEPPELSHAHFGQDPQPSAGISRIRESIRGSRAFRRRPRGARAPASGIRVFDGAERAHRHPPHGLVVVARSRTYGNSTCSSLIRCCSKSARRSRNTVRMRTSSGCPSAVRLDELPPGGDPIVGSARTHVGMVRVDNVIDELLERVRRRNRHRATLGGRQRVERVPDRGADRLPPAGRHQRIRGALHSRSRCRSSRTLRALRKSAATMSPTVVWSKSSLMSASMSASPE